jgi:hypothetical protein
MGDPRYVPLEEFREYAQATGLTVQTRLESALLAAEGLVDRWCRRRFDPATDVVSSRVPRSTAPGWLTIDDAVQVDTVEARATATSPWREDLGWTPGPGNAPADGQPYTYLSGGFTPLGDVRVTGRFGWPDVAAEVRQAVLLQAARFGQRPNAALGIATIPSLEGTGMRLRSYLDPDAELLLQPFRRDPVLVA